MPEVLLMYSLLVSENGIFRTDVPCASIAEVLANPANILWMDVQDPADEDIAVLRNSFGFHPLAIEDAIRAHERPKVDAYDLSSGASLLNVPNGASAGDAPAPEVRGGSYYFVVFYAAVYDSHEDHITAQAVSLFIGANFLVTVHCGGFSHVDDTLARWQAPNSPLGHRVGALVHALLDALVDDYFPLMDRVADRVEDLEDTIFVSFTEESIETIFRLKKGLLNARRTIAPERDVLNVLLRRQLPIFTSEDVTYLQDVYDHIVRVTDNIDTYRDLLSSALDSYLSLQSNKLNQIMKTLTVASIILMTASLITGFYGQNFKRFPALDFPIGSAWSLLLIVVATVSLVIYFRRKKWL
jgi:magnesium transporter